ncbi:MAG: SMP-30/gluconolactonase/LRE family protein, partial [Verrucomicrobiae bacterium]|nr:SMP-30/gluconolactonase/LRE family protein [Verrucomicrobiae bacterium]NNJ86125.1 SMP-30/gluconolactonase/LRE family protein [Akkermansiaceae bacterium]
METIEIAGSYRAQWGEGPIWWNQRLLYVDIERQKVLEYDPATGEETIQDVSTSVGRVGTVVPRSSGGLLVAGDTGIHFLDPETGQTTAITDPEADKRDNRFNDGKCSPDGRFFAGTISLAKKAGDAALYRLDHDLSIHTAFAGVTNSNGIVWSHDAGTCYYIDTPRQEVIAFDYSTETGELSAERVAFSTSHISA